MASIDDSKSTLYLALLPHLVSHATLANNDLKRAMQEPLAVGRDEVIYMFASHPRLTLGKRVSDDGYRDVYQPKHGVGFFSWDTEEPWGRVRLPEGARPSATGFAVLDPDLQALEGLPPLTRHDAARDPDGELGQQRHELMSWIYDRYFEHQNPPATDRGAAHGRPLSYEVLYVGQSARDALTKRVGKGHQKLVHILARTAWLYPGVLVNVFPCELRVGVGTPDTASAFAPLGETGLGRVFGRQLLIDAAEQALIRAFEPPYNKSNTVSRRFPRSSAGDRLKAAGIREVRLGAFGLPPTVMLRTDNTHLGGADNEANFAFEL